MVCEKCYGGGMDGDEYCGCMVGELKKRQDRSEKRSERLRAKEQSEKAEAKAKVQELKAEQMELLESEKKSDRIIPITPYNVDDWIEVIDGKYKGTIGVVERVSRKDATILLEAVRDRDGSGVGGRAWVGWDDIEILHIPYDEDKLLELIDIALDKGDKDWFMELTAQLPE